MSEENKIINTKAHEIGDRVFVVLSTNEKFTGGRIWEDTVISRNFEVDCASGECKLKSYLLHGVSGDEDITVKAEEVFSTFEEAKARLEALIEEKKEKASLGENEGDKRNEALEKAAGDICDLLKAIDNKLVKDKAGNGK